MIVLTAQYNVVKTKTNHTNEFVGVDCSQIQQELMVAWVQHPFGVMVVPLWTLYQHYVTISINSRLGVCYLQHARMTQQICLTVHSQLMYDVFI